MSASKRRRVNPFGIIIGGFLLLVALAAVYLGLAEPLHLWPHEQTVSSLHLNARTPS